MNNPCKTTGSHLKIKSDVGLARILDLDLDLDCLDLLGIIQIQLKTTSIFFIFFFTQDCFSIIKDNLSRSDGII